MEKRVGTYLGETTGRASEAMSERMLDIWEGGVMRQRSHLLSPCSSLPSSLSSSPPLTSSPPYVNLRHVPTLRHSAHIPPILIHDPELTTLLPNPLELLHDRNPVPVVSERGGAKRQVEDC